MLNSFIKNSTTRFWLQINEWTSSSSTIHSLRSAFLVFPSFLFLFMQLRHWLVIAENLNNFFINELLQIWECHADVNWSYNEILKFLLQQVPYHHPTIKCWTQASHSTRVIFFCSFYQHIHAHTNISFFGSFLALILLHLFRKKWFSFHSYTGWLAKGKTYTKKSFFILFYFIFWDFLWALCGLSKKLIVD